MVIVKTYDEHLNSMKLNTSCEFIGTLNYHPMTKEEEDKYDEAMKENEYLPSNEFHHMNRYPVLHLIKAIDNPTNLLFSTKPLIEDIFSSA